DARIATRHHVVDPPLRTARRTIDDRHLDAIAMERRADGLGCDVQVVVTDGIDEAEAARVQREHAVPALGLSHLAQLGRVTAAAHALDPFLLGELVEGGHEFRQLSVAHSELCRDFARVNRFLCLDDQANHFALRRDSTSHAGLLAPSGGRKRLASAGSACASVGLLLRLGLRIRTCEGRLVCLVCGSPRSSLWRHRPRYWSTTSVRARLSAGSARAAPRFGAAATATSSCPGWRYQCLRSGCSLLPSFWASRSRAASRAGRPWSQRWAG